jgi:hypothetical protein
MKLLIPFVTIALLAGLAPAADQPAVKLKEEDGRVVVTVGGKPFTVYHFGDNEGRPFVRPYFYPVAAADGTEVTSDQVISGGDHPHHRSLWVSHGDVNGADHWSFQQKPIPKQRHVRFRKLEGDTLVEDLEWEAKGGDGVVLKEIRSVRFFTYPDGHRGIDFNLILAPVGGKVTLGETKEAGLCAVRLKKSISDKPTLTNARGQTGEKEVWGKPAEWCDLSGQIDGKPYGVAVLDHPQNPRYPSTWHARDYGLLAANVFGLHEFDKSLPKGSGDFTINPGHTARFRYRVVIHTGDAKGANLDEKTKEFAAMIIEPGKIEP